MQVIGKVNAQEFEASRRIVWAPHYRLNLFNNFMWHRLGFFRLMGCILAVSISVTAFVHDPAHLKVALIVAFISLAIVLLYLVARSEHPSKKLLAKINAGLPESLEINATGIQVLTLDGITSHAPWSSFLGWQASDSVAVITFPRSPNLLIVPLHELSATDRAMVKELLRASLGDPTDTSKTDTSFLA